MDVTLRFALAVAGIALVAAALDRVRPGRRTVAVIAACALAVPALPALATMPPPILRLPLPLPGFSSTPDPVPVAPAPGASYVVVGGDTLSGIARRALEAARDSVDGAEFGGYWRRIHAANRDVIGGNPHLIFPGQHLHLPALDGG